MRAYVHYHESTRESASLTQLHMWVSEYVFSLALLDGTEIVSYHFADDPSATIRFPHVHLGPVTVRSDTPVRPGELHKVHFPTGHVSFQQFIRLLITEFGVEPRRPDWEAILANA